MPSYASKIITGINEQIINPLILLLFGMAFVLFLWGVFNFIRAADGGTKGKGDKAVVPREQSQRHIIWGIVGMVIMASVISILKIVTSTFGVDLPDGY